MSTRQIVITHIRNFMSKQKYLILYEVFFYIILYEVFFYIILYEVFFYITLHYINNIFILYNLIFININISHSPLNTFLYNYFHFCSLSLVFQQLLYFLLHLHLLVLNQ